MKKVSQQLLCILLLVSCILSVMLTALVYGPPVVGATLNSFIVQFAKNEVPLSLPGGVSVIYNYDCADAHIAAEKAQIGTRYLVCEKYQTINEIAQVYVSTPII